MSWEGKQQFVVEAAVSGAPSGTNNVADRAMSPFCDRYLLTIEKDQLQVPVNVQNISDIEFTFAWTVGHPTSFFWQDVP